MSLSFPLHRAFLALPLEGQAKFTFQDLQHSLEPFAELLRFQNPQSPHLTLYYWESLMEIEYHEIVKRAQWIAERSHPFSMQVNGVETFDRKGLPQVLYLTIDRCEELAHIKKLCPWPNNCHAERSGAETKRFSPHITLARVRNPNAFHVHQKKIMKLLEDVSFDIPVDRIRFYAEIDQVKQTAIEECVFGRGS